jgi:O-antigen/teichoic acid export membrane protein
MAFATAVLIVGKFGLELGASRLASEYGVRKPGTLRALFRAAIGLRLVFTLPVAVVSYLLAGQLAAWFHDPGLATPIRVTAAVIMCASFYEFMEHFLIGLNRHATVSAVRSLTLFSRVTVTIVLVLVGLGAAQIIAGYCAAWAIGITVFSVLLLKRLPGTDDPIDRGTLTRSLLVLSVPLAVSSASVAIYSQMDKLMLGYFVDVDEVGQYSAARGIAEVSLFPAFAFVMTLRPALASRFTSGALEECAGLIRNSLRAALIFGVLFGSVFFALSVPLVTFVISRDFLYAGELMGIFIWIIVLRSLGAMVLPALVAAEKTKYYAYLTALSAVINFGLNLALIPAYQARGAVVATIISYGFLLFFGLRQVFKIFNVKPRMRAVGLAFRTVLAGIAAGALLWLILNLIEDGPMGSGAWILFWASLQVIVYFTFLFLFKVISPADVRSVLGGFTKLKG